MLIHNVSKLIVKTRFRRVGEGVSLQKKQKTKNRGAHFLKLLLYDFKSKYVITRNRARKASAKNHYPISEPGLPVPTPLGSTLWGLGWEMFNSRGVGGGEGRVRVAVCLWFMRQLQLSYIPVHKYQSVIEDKAVLK